VGERLVAVREYPAIWVIRAKVDRDELAKLRLVEKWPIARLQVRFGLSKTTIKKKLREIRRANGLKGYFRVRNGQVCEVR